MDDYFNSSKDKQGDETDTTNTKMYPVLRLTVNRGFLYCFGIRAMKLMKTAVACSSNSVKPARPRVGQGSCACADQKVYSTQEMVLIGRKAER